MANPEFNNESEVPMKCSMCGKASPDRRLVIGAAGLVCPECAAVAHQERKDLHEALLAENLGDMPDTLDIVAFERLVLKYALHFMRDVSPAYRDIVLRANPAFVFPEEFAMWVKDRLLQELPHRYVAFTEVQVHDRIFPRGEYRVVADIPARVICAALRKARLVEHTKRSRRTQPTEH
jgi:hypothetical protein